MLERLKTSKAFYSFVAMTLIFIFSAIISPDFISISNQITILRQASTLLVLSAGLTAVVLIGGMDLSVGASAAFVGCTCAQFLKMGIPVGIVFLIGIVIGILIGLFNGFLVSVVKLPPFIATYGVNWVIKGFSTIIMNGAVIYGLPDGFTWFGVGYIGPVPVIVIIAAIVVALMYIFLTKTTYGRDIYSVGANSEAALYSGVSVKKVTFVSFILCGVTAAIGGLLMTARLDAAEAAMGDAYGLMTIAAVVIGGTSMSGGEGGIAGTIVGALTLTMIVNIMNLVGISSFAQQAVVGTVILIMVLFDSYVRARNLKIKIKS